MLENFVEFEYMMSFAGMVMITVIVTQFLKGLFSKIKTKYVVLGVAFALCILGAVLFGNAGSVIEVIKTIVTWLVNTILVWFSAMKAFEVVTNTEPNP